MERTGNFTFSVDDSFDALAASVAPLTQWWLSGATWRSSAEQTTMYLNALV